MFWILLFITILILVVAFAAIGIKILLKKDGKFERHCCHSEDSCICGGKGGSTLQTKTIVKKC